MNSTVGSPTSSVRPQLAARTDRLRQRISAEGWGALLVLDLADVSYLTGMVTSNAALVVTPSTSVLVTDFRYVAEAREAGLEVLQVNQSLFAELGRALGEIAGSGPVAYGPTSLTHRSFLQLTDGIPDSVTLRAVDGVVAELRRVKDAGELEAIRRAATLLDDAYAHLVGEGLRGRSERELVWIVERYLREHGAARMSFDAIVAGGANGAYPHHTPGADAIPDDTLVTVDIGCVVDGYCSDCTRTFAVGDPGDELRRAYEVTLEAQLAGVRAVRAGAVGSEVDAVSRTIVDAAGHGDHFGHGLGHGVGLDVHEAPRLARTSGDVLEAGMVVTVEPGIYLPGVGGVRIEDLLVVTDGEPEILTTFPKELTFV